MDYQVSWSPDALDDVDEIVSYIARDSALYAASVAMEIKQTSRLLTEFALRGRVVPELGDEEIRERFVYSYRLIYRVRDNDVLIAAVIHGKRLLDNVEDRFTDEED